MIWKTHVSQQVQVWSEAIRNDTNAMCPDKSVDEYIACSKEKVTWVKGMSGGERRLAFKRGDLNGTRENPATYQKHVETDENAELWFHHGLLDPKTGNPLMTQIIQQANKQNKSLKHVGVLHPSGEFYDAYKLVKSFRDGLQKAIWINKGNPELRDRLIKAMTAMANDPNQWRLTRLRMVSTNGLLDPDGDPNA